MVKSSNSRSGVLADNMSYKIAMKSEDESGNTSPVSNIIELSTAPKLAYIETTTALGPTTGPDTTTIDTGTDTTVRETTTIAPTELTTGPDTTTVAPGTTPTTSETTVLYTTLEFDYECQYYCTNLTFGNFVAGGHCMEKFCECPSSIAISCDTLFPRANYRFCSDSVGCVPQNECVGNDACSFMNLQTTTASTAPTPIPTALPCFNLDEACKLESDNILNISTNKSNVQECVQECANQNCTYYTYFTENAENILQNQCYLFSSCDTMISAQGSITGTGDQENCLCSIELTPTDGEVLESLYAPNEYNCLVKCLGIPHCSHYVYYENLGICELLKDPSSYSRPQSSGVRTGPRECSISDDENSQQCGLAILDNASWGDSHLLIDNPGSQEMTVRSGMRNCYVELDIVTIGAGGSYYGQAGGGSGFVFKSSIQLQTDDTIKVEFMEDTRSYNIYVNSSMQQYIMFQSVPGQDGNATGFSVDHGLLFLNFISCG